MTRRDFLAASATATATFVATSGASPARPPEEIPAMRPDVRTFLVSDADGTVVTHRDFNLTLDRVIEAENRRLQRFIDNDLEVSVAEWAAGECDLVVWACPPDGGPRVVAVLRPGADGEYRVIRAGRD